MKVIGFLLLEVILICIHATKIRPVSEAHYWSKMRKYMARRPPIQLNAWRRHNYPSGRLWQLRNSHYNPYPKMKLDGVNARVIPLQVGKKAIQVWQKGDYDIDYSKRPRMCPNNYIAKCYRSPYIEIKGRPARKCVTLCKDKPCFVPCVCECKPKSKVHFSKAMIPHIVVPVDKRQLIPSCNRHQFVRCTAQIYGEATNELCAHGCGEGVCPLTCNCQCIGDRFSRRQNIIRRIANFNNANRGPQLALHQNIAAAVGTGNPINFDNALPQGNINLENGIFLEGPGIGHAGNILDSTASNDIIFDGVEVTAAGSRSGGGILLSEGNNVVGGIHNNAGGSGGLLITDGQDGVLLNNGLQSIDVGGPADLSTDIVGEPIQLISPVDGTVAGPIDLAATGIGPDNVVGPLHGVETETVQVQIDVQSPGGHGNAGAGGPGNLGHGGHGKVGHGGHGNAVHGGHGNAGHGGHGNAGHGGHGNVGHGGHGNLGNGGHGHVGHGGHGGSAGNGGHGTTGGKGVQMNGAGNGGSAHMITGHEGQHNVMDAFAGPGGIPIDFGNQNNNQINNVGSGGGQATGADNLKLTIPGPKGKKGGNINLDLSGVLSSIPGLGSGSGNGGNELGFLNQLGGSGGGEGIFQNELANLFGKSTEQGGGQGGIGLFGGSTMDGFGGLTGRSDTSPLSGLGSEISFDALHFGASQNSNTGGNNMNNGNNMASLMSRFLNTGSGITELEERCLNGTPFSCTVTPEWRNTPGLLKWCKDTCSKGNCDRERCKCTCITQDEFLPTKMI